MNRYMKSALGLAVAALVFSASEASAQFAIAGGPSFAASGELKDDFEMGYHLQASFNLGLPLLPVGFRADGIYNRHPHDVDGHAQIIGGNVNAVLDIPLIGVTPYLIGGVGLYNSKYDDGHDHPSTTDFGANIGAGARIGLPGLGIFVEARLHNLFSEGDRFVPVSFGFRF
jgi:opacity protein-like surface antigen